MRPAPRLFTRDSLGSGRFSLSAEQARYLGQVLRLGPGAEIRLFNGRDGEWLYRIASISRRGGEATPVEQRRLQAEHSGTPILLFAPLKRAPTELLIQKGTELGVAAFQPVITARTNRDQLRIDRLESIAIEAAEQCERLSVPSIAAPADVFDTIDRFPAFVFCDEAGDQPGEPWGGESGRAGPASEVFAAAKAARSVPDAVLIGPEGGFTPEERGKLRALTGACAVSLGPRILRAETAAMVALTLWQVHFGDFA